MQDLLSNGIDSLQDDLIEFMNEHTDYSQIQVEVPFVEYELRDGSKFKIVQGNCHISGVLTENGWIYY
ncbi:hypothetical protein [Tenuibacillus multivorans]|uniref:Uncharacterized protein n=1 Tax=Tenuibacillus multivorans TaxID=237069 RepID=A0A1H0AX72_9BACI|nr:hypothetical protein [Tenuibacillus multivorans]GEL77786.1 hypothetical protein TMU01_20210 [Tenuibacillus multivorans]SDN37806.1 hypothetical protein SAMN05216498_2110 [Tenuibacillus multivorans]